MDPNKGNNLPYYSKGKITPGKVILQMYQMRGIFSLHSPVRKCTKCTDLCNVEAVHIFALFPIKQRWPTKCINVCGIIVTFYAALTW